MQYSGGKAVQGSRWQHLMRSVPGGKRWVEPFAGGLGVFPYVAPSYESALVSDLSPIMDMWVAARGGWEPFVDYEESDNGRYEARQAALAAVKSGRELTPQEIYILHTTGVSGQSGGFFSKSERTRAGLRRFRLVTDTLRSVPTEIRRCDYREVLAEVGPSDVVYLDPPYYHGRPNDKAWLAPSSIPSQEFKEAAIGAVFRGAVVFVSHYGAGDQFSPDDWICLDVRVDMASEAATQKQSRRSEYLYVNRAAARYFDDLGTVAKAVLLKSGKRATAKGRGYEHTKEKNRLIQQVGRDEVSGLVMVPALLQGAHITGMEHQVGRDAIFLTTATFNQAMEVREAWVDGGTTCTRAVEVRKDGVVRVHPDFRVAIPYHGRIIRRVAEAWAGSVPSGNQHDEAA